MHPTRKTFSSPWVPILTPTDSLTARAWDAVNAIAEAVEKQTYPPMQMSQRQHRTYEEPLLYGYLALASKNRLWLDRTTENLNMAIEQASMSRGYSGLFGGLCGLGWVVEHLPRVLEQMADNNGATSDLDEEEDEDLNADIDLAVIADLRRELGLARPYDLIGGLVGFGVYFLDRLPGESAALGLKLVLDRLEELAQRTDSGMTWHSGPELLPEWQREKCPGGYYNMGVAHGIPGILFFLSELSAAGLERERAVPMLESAMDWFLAQKRPTGSRSWFGSWIPTPGESSDSRLAWCYGDLGILAVLQQIARRTGRADWQRSADNLLNHCLALPVEAGGVVDAPLCHGATGNAHIFNRIYQANGDSRCREAAFTWFEIALAMRQSEGGVGGFFQVTRPDQNGPQVLEPNPAFLDGAIGLALGLLAALTPIEPQWDRMLLLSGRAWGDTLG